MHLSQEGLVEASPDFTQDMEKLSRVTGKDYELVEGDVSW